MKSQTYKPTSETPSPVVSSLCDGNQFVLFDTKCLENLPPDPTATLSLSGHLLLVRISDAQQPHGSQQLLPPGLLLLLLFLLFQLTHQDGAQLPQPLLRKLPPPELQHPSGLCGQLLAGPAGGSFCLWVHTVLRSHRLSLYLHCGGELLQEGVSPELWNVLQCPMMRIYAVLLCILTINMIVFNY